MDAVTAFRQELAAPVAERLALAIARIVFPWLNTDKYLRELDDLAELVEVRLRGVTGGGARATGLVRVLRDELGFRGNNADYYNADNSFLNLVLPCVFLITYAMSI
jgi:regulator of sirC expression with transglutaminase-like and TPR domain